MPDFWLIVAEILTLLRDIAVTLELPRSFARVLDKGIRWASRHGKKGRFINSTASNISYPTSSREINESPYAGSKAWQVFIGDAVLSGGDWPGDYRYWTTKEKADHHAESKVKSGWTNVKVEEVDPPMHKNMFPANSHDQTRANPSSQHVYHGPRGGRFTLEISRDGKIYRRYF